MLRIITTVAIQKVVSMATCVRMDSEDVPKLQIMESVVNDTISRKELHPSVKTSLTLSQMIP